jgi:hypothetical protein
MYFWMSTEKLTVGIIASVDTAVWLPQSVPNYCMNICTPTGTVVFSSSRRNSLHENRNEKMVTAAIPGTDNRNTMRQNAPNRDDPST